MTAKRPGLMFEMAKRGQKRVMRSQTVLILGAVTLVACQTAPTPAMEAAPAMDAAPAMPLLGPAKAGFDMSEALCSGCHAIRVNEISPNPNSPTFEMIANTQGLTEVTLRDWLRDSHNFPERMNFEVAADDVDVLAAYIITLRRDDYTPPNQ